MAVKPEVLADEEVGTASKRKKQVSNPPPTRSRRLRYRKYHDDDWECEKEFSQAEVLRNAFLSDEDSSTKEPERKKKKEQHDEDWEKVIWWRRYCDSFTMIMMLLLLRRESTFRKSPFW
jgi:hypothetical protein